MADEWGDLPDWFAESDDEADNDDDDEFSTIPAAQHALILLDCQRSMFRSCIPDPEFPDDQMSPFDWALTACEKIVRAKIRTLATMKTGRRDGIGILLFNTCHRMPQVEEEDRKLAAAEKHSGAINHSDDVDDEDEHENDGYRSGMGPFKTRVHNFVTLSPPGIATVKKIKSALDDPILSRSLDLEAEYCPSEEEEKMQETLAQFSALQLALNETVSIFRTSKCVKKVKKGEQPDAMQVWIITNDDDPCKGNEDLMHFVKTTASDMRENEIECVVWPLPSSGKSVSQFDYSRFYAHIQAKCPLAAISTDPKETEANALNIDLLLQEFQQVWKRTRRAFTVPLILPDWKDDSSRPGIQLDFYRLVQLARIPTKIAIHQQSGSVLQRIKQLLAAGGGEILAEYRKDSQSEPGKDRLRTFVDFGDHRVPMSKADRVAIQSASNANSDFASLLLHGFKRNDAIPLAHTLENAYFAYPTDEKVEGSNAAFAFLHESMIRKGVLAIGELLTRVSATSRLVAIWPLEEEFETIETTEEVESTMVRPAGMIVVALPFEDEIRALDPDASNESFVKTGIGLASEELVAAAKALIKKQVISDVEIGEQLENASVIRFWDFIEHFALDDPLPADREFDTTIDKEEIIRVAKEEIGEFVSNLPMDMKLEESVARKRKLEPDDSGVDWETLFIEGRIHECTKAVLQTKLRSLGEKTSGKKDDLVQRLQKLLQVEFST